MFILRENNATESAAACATPLARSTGIRVELLEGALFSGVTASRPHGLLLGTFCLTVSEIEGGAVGR